MALDLANGYSRKDSASASNVYYGYSVNSNPLDSDKVFAIRLVTNASGVETVKWTNNNSNSYVSSWSGRTFSFSAPGGSLGLTATTSIISETYTIGTFSITSVKQRTALFSWSSLNGVSKYLVTSSDNSGRFLSQDGSILRSPYFNTSYGGELLNLTSYSQTYTDSGTYTFTVRAENVAGFTSSTVVINFAL